MGICQAHYMPSPFSCSGCYSGQPHSFGPLYANCGYQQSWIVSRHCLGLETFRDRFFDVSVSVSDPTVSVSVSRSFLDFLETVSKRKSCLFGNCLEAKVLFSCRSGLQSSRTNCILFRTSYSIITE